MQKTSLVILSASRRTDIPAFYMDWFMEQIYCGVFRRVNPFNGRESVFIAEPNKIHTIVFWSKNFHKMLETGSDDKLVDMGYNLFFNFTINSTSMVLEPNVPTLDEKLKQVKQLCEKYDPKTINWRFDPICFYKVDDGEIKNNLCDFVQIADKLSQYGIKRCVTSFMDIYPKIQKRIKKNLYNLKFIDPPVEKKVDVLIRMEKVLINRDIQLYTCCEKDILQKLPKNTSIKKNSCISATLLSNLFNKKISVKKDYGQRIKQGCGCNASVDIGLYKSQPCFHNCLFCYANS